MLEVVVFVCGMAVMVLEMVGARILSPYLGTSIVVWTSLIGTILASLSLGYWWGGALADKKPAPRALSLVILLAGLCMSLVAVAKTFVLSFFSQHLAGNFGAVLASLILFGLPSVLLGMVAPYAVRLKLNLVEHTGRTAGRLYALSTIGSIVGTFLAGFFLIAYMGSANILFALSLTLILTSFLASRKDAALKLSLLCVAVLIFFALRLRDQAQAKIDFHDVDTLYSRVLVYTSKDPHTGRPIRVLATMPQRAQSAMFLDSENELVFGYTRFFKLFSHFVPQAKRVLLLGGGGYSFPKYVRNHYPDLTLDVVELDPGITDLAKRFFALKEHPGLTIRHTDARMFLNASHPAYDVILVDVFSAHYAVPFHLTTIETAERMRALLNPGGVVIMNTITAIEGEQGQFLRAEYNTFKRVFPRVELFPLTMPDHGEVVQNVVLVASAAEASLNLRSPDPERQAFLDYRWTRPVQTTPGPLRDEFAPVDRYVSSLWE